ncbi:MAG: 50S ribosomal protein L3 [Candidatus Baldrarchaeia archaeon]
MGHRRTHAPKRGSLAYLPRGRAARPIGRIRNWPEYDGKPTILGFAAYKAGMTHAIIVDTTNEKSPLYGQEVAKAVTILDAPPLVACGIRAYVETPYGLRTFSEVWAPELYEDLSRVFPLPKKYDFDAALQKIEDNLGNISELRMIVHTLPRLAAGVPKKKPDIMEYKIGGGTIEEQWEYAKSILGSEIRTKDVLKEGQYVDVIAITKGKGFEGPVKRWGVKILPRKKRKGRRKVGSIGPWHPARVSYTVPRAGQLGYHQRTEYNKLILKIGECGEEVVPSGGFPHYGVIKGDYIILLGSVPGPAKRLIRLRYAIRPPDNNPFITPPKIVYLSLSSKIAK